MLVFSHKTYLYYFLLNFKKQFLFICLFLAVLGLCCCLGFSLVSVSRGYSSLWYRGYSLVAQWWLLLLWGTGSRVRRLQQLWFPGSRAQAQWFRCSSLVAPWALGILPDWGLNPHLLHWQVDSLPLSHHRSPEVIIPLISSNCF